MGEDSQRASAQLGRPLQAPQTPRGAPAADLAWRELRRGLAGFIARRVGDPEVVEDLVQEVMLRVHQRIDTLDKADRFAGWVYQITRNVIIDHYRARSGLEVPMGAQAELAAVRIPAVELPARPDIAQLRSELADCVAPMVDRLPQRYREALLLTEFEGLTQQLAADRLGLSLSGLKSRVQRGRGRLKGMLVDCCQIELDRRGAVTGYEPRVGRGDKPCCQASLPE